VGVDPLLKKLQHKGGAVVVLDAPDELRPTLAALETETPVRTEAGTDEPFVLRFVRTCADIEAVAPDTVAALAPDGVLWFAYPKKSSRRYDSDIGRDDSWQALGELGYEAVRQVAVDADWSALRFRHVDRIGSLTRDSSRVLSQRGRDRIAER
jgi:hypothetical protein